MSRLTTLSTNPTRLQSGRDEVVGWIGGLGFTFLLFFSLAHLEDSGAKAPADDIAELRLVSLPLAPPPPPPTVESNPPPPEVQPFAGIELGASDSPVHVAVVPPDLEILVQTAPLPPRALLPFGRFHTEFKPRVEVAGDVRHDVYRESEVDQRPIALVRTVPPIPSYLFGENNSLRVQLLLLIEPNGSVTSARIVSSSGQPEFDEIVAETVKEGWEFSPAIRRGKPVRCLAQQPFRVVKSSGSPFETR